MSITFPFLTFFIYFNVPNPLLSSLYLPPTVMLMRMLLVSLLVLLVVPLLLQLLLPLLKDFEDNMSVLLFIIMFNSKIHTYTYINIRKENEYGEKERKYINI